MKPPYPGQWFLSLVNWYSVNQFKKQKQNKKNHQQQKKKTLTVAEQNPFY